MPWRRAWSTLGVLASAATSLLLQESHPSVAGLVGFLGGLGAIALGLQWLQRHRARTRARAALGRLPLSGFVGIEPLTERRADSFFGREKLCKEIQNALRAGEHVLYSIHGRSGAGKTSLVRAALMPWLDAAGFRVAYVRVADAPLEGIGQALVRSGLNDVGPDPEALAAEVHRYFEATGERVFVFVDHFEQFFGLSRADREPLIRWIRRLAHEPHRCGHLVVILRDESLARLEVFDAAVGEALAQGARFVVPPFSVPEARATLMRLTRVTNAGEVEGSQWDTALLEAVLADLQQMGRPGEPSILPAELQMICNTLQRRGVTCAKHYPGRTVLLTDYIASAVRAAQDEEAALSVLSQLATADGRGRKPPRSPAEIAAGLPGYGARMVRAILEDLDRCCRLVVEVEGGNFELAHDRLAEPIAKLVSPDFERTARANRTLIEARRRSITQPRALLGPLATWRIRRHATEPLSPTDRDLLRRSRNAWLRRAAIVVLGLPLIRLLALNAFVHLDDRVHPNGMRTVVARQGFRSLQPFLGSQVVVFDTGLEPQQLHSVSATHLANHQWFLHMPPFADHYLDCFLWGWGHAEAHAWGQDAVRPWMRAATDYEIAPPMIVPGDLELLAETGRVLPDLARVAFEVGRSHAEPEPRAVLFIARSLPEDRDVTGWLLDLAGSNCLARNEALLALQERGEVSDALVAALAARTLDDPWRIGRACAAALLARIDGERARELAPDWARRLRAEVEDPAFITDFESWGHAFARIGRLADGAAAIAYALPRQDYGIVESVRILCSLPALPTDAREHLETHLRSGNELCAFAAAVLLVRHGSRSVQIADALLSADSSESTAAFADLLVAACPSDSVARSRLEDWLLRRERWSLSRAEARSSWLRLRAFGADIEAARPHERSAAWPVVGGWLDAIGAGKTEREQILEDLSMRRSEADRVDCASFVLPDSESMRRLCRARVLEDGHPAPYDHPDSYWDYLIQAGEWDPELASRVAEQLRTLPHGKTLGEGVRHVLGEDPGFRAVIVDMAENGRLTRSNEECLRAYAEIRWRPYDDLPSVRAARLAEALVSFPADPVLRWSVLAAIELAAFGRDADEPSDVDVEALRSALRPMLGRDLLIDRLAAAEALERLERRATGTPLERLITIGIGG